MARQKIGSLWKNKGKLGETYLSGEIEVIRGIKMKIVVFKNTMKKSQKAPDYNVYLAPSKEELEKKKPKVEKIEDENEI